MEWCCVEAPLWGAHLFGVLDRRWLWSLLDFEADLLEHVHHAIEFLPLGVGNIRRRALQKENEASSALITCLLEQ